MKPTETPFDEIKFKDFGAVLKKVIEPDSYKKICSSEEDLSTYINNVKISLWKVCKKCIKNDELNGIDDWRRVFRGELNECLIYQPSKEIDSKHPDKMKQFKILSVKKNINLNIFLALLYVSYFTEGLLEKI